MKKNWFNFVNFICKLFDMETTEQHATSDSVVNEAVSEATSGVAEPALTSNLMCRSNMNFAGRIERDRIRDLIVDKFAQFECDDRKVTSVRVSPQMLSDIRRYLLEVFDPCTHRELINRGIIGTLYGAQVILDRYMTDEHIVCSDDSFTITTNDVRFIGGVSGFSGYTGFSGISGYSGVVGISGMSGYSGISGYSGVSRLSDEDDGIVVIEPSNSKFLNKFDIINGEDISCEDEIDNEEEEDEVDEDDDEEIGDE